MDELLQSIQALKAAKSPEIIVVEDGSVDTCVSVVEKYKDSLDIKYCFKKNSGPGDSRNYGMQRAHGDYFILLDSDCILPEDYLLIVERALEEAYVDAFGGPDKAHDSFSSWQKAVSYSMTSFLTTGGLRNSESSSQQFQLRSFNMGLSRKAYNLTGGFSKQRIGEDIDLNYKLIEKGCTKRLISAAFVFHKRRSSVAAFFQQTLNFGAARPLLNKMHTKSFKFTYWLPSLFVLGFLASVLFLYFGYWGGVVLYLIYALIIMADAFSKTNQLTVGLYSAVAAFTQFFGYGLGYLRSVFRLSIQRKDLKEAFPKMFT